MSKIENLKKMPITSKKRVWFLISGIIVGFAGVMMGLFAILGLGALNLGIDFTGGTIMDINLVTFLDDSNYDDVTKIITDTFDDAGLTYSAPQKSEDTTITIRFSDSISGRDASAEQMTEVRSNLMSVETLGVDSDYESLFVQFQDYFGDDFTSEGVFIYDAVAATASSEIWLNALICTLIAAVLILIYVAIRFASIDTAISSIIALAHDVLIMIAFVAIFRVQINAPFIAAMITIVGYSINNTIVVFDRLRENSKKKTLNTLAPSEIADLSVKQTFRRSLNASITTLLTTVMLFIFGVSSIREFMFPIIIGLMAGTYSSIFIAPSMWVMFRDRHIKKSKTSASKEKVKADNK